MKLLRHGAKGAEKPALLDAQGQLRDLSKVLPDISAATLTPKSLQRLRDARAAYAAAGQHPGRLAVPWSGMGKFIAIGLNYADHAAEANMPIPKEPIVFMKSTTCAVGPNHPVVLPQGSLKSDWEVELGVVIGSQARYVSEADALKHVAGYCVVNDVSEREYQTRARRHLGQGQGLRHLRPDRSLAGDGRRGPRPADPGMWLEVNGHRWQNGSTKTMIFGVASWCQLPEPLHDAGAGRLITTGTPPGVGMGVKPNPVYLKPGDVMRLGIEGLGEQQQTVHAWDPVLIDN